MNQDLLQSLRIDPGHKRRPRRTVWIIFTGIALAAGASAYFATPSPNDERRVQAGPAKAAPVPAATTNSPAARPPAVRPAAPPGGVLLTVSGYIVNHERIEISPRFMGLVKWIGVSKGDSVTNGQVVVRLDDAEQRARVLESEGRVANARAALSKAQLDFERISNLATSKVESKQALDDAGIRLEVARATVQEAQGQLDLVKTYLDWTVIRSPISGVVLEKLAKAGELVMPQSFGGGRGPSTALMALADPSDLQVEVDINEADLPKISLRQKCRVSPEAYPDKFFEGFVAEMAPEANRQKGTLQIKVQIINPNRYLTPELSARVDFLAPAAEARPGQ